MNAGTKTIEQFGEQWTHYSDNDGYFGSAELFKDFVEPFDTALIKDKVVADIGAGQGRFSNSLLELGAGTVYAVEPSKAADLIPGNVAPEYRDKLVVLNVKGDDIGLENVLDYAFSIGVIHHIPETEPVIQAIYKAMKPDGQFVIWLYGREGNLPYLVVLNLFRPIVKYMPLSVKAFVSAMLDIPLSLYIKLCLAFPNAPLPLKDYMVSILAKLTPHKRRVVIYDQLNPIHAKYYRKDEAYALMASAPFKVEVSHRKKYSWVVIGTK